RRQRSSRGRELRKLQLQLRLRACLELAGALAAHAELATERGEGHLRLRQDAPLDDVPLALVEQIERVPQPRVQRLLAMLARDEVVLPLVGSLEGVHDREA